MGTKKTNGWVIYIIVMSLSLTNCNKDLDPNVELSSFPELDDAIVKKMTEYNIPALSVAIVKDEKLVYAKSYGYADVESNQIATNDNLYRIASVSKPITAIAILKLVQDGLITLDQKVFGSGGILGNDYGTPPVGSNIDLITVRHLMEHKSGWANSVFFTNFEITQTQLITYLVTTQPLDYLPGTTTYYLNIGYLILGRVIEKITNAPYEEYVRTNITNGIPGMKIGRNTLAEKFPNEVTYYSTNGSSYLLDIERMDSSAGWIASSIDLARFIVRIDRNSYVKDIVNPELLHQFYFGNTAWSHSGSWPGTASVLSRLNDTFSFVFLVNTDGVFANDLKSVISKQIISRKEWPIYDLF